jgi:hypothetical protein
VEAALEHDDPSPAVVLARELDRALDRLGAGVREEGLAAQRELRQPLGQAHRRLGVEEVAHVREPLGLL